MLIGTIDSLERCREFVDALLRRFNEHNGAGRPAKEGVHAATHFGPTEEQLEKHLALGKD